MLKSAIGALVGSAGVLIACAFGAVLIIAPVVGGSVGTHASAEHMQAGGHLRPDAPVPEPYLQLVLAAGQVCPQIGPAHIAAQIEVESSWNPDAYTDVGEVPAHGIAQFTMPTWQSWGGDYDIELEHTSAGQRLTITGGNLAGDPYNPAHAIIAQAHLMCDLHRWASDRRADGQLDGQPLQLAWAAYFCGRGCVLAAGGIPAGGLAAEYPGKVAAALTRYASVGHIGPGGWVMPLPEGSYRRTSGYGMRTLGGVTRMHQGVDWAAAEGVPMFAAADGVVSTARCTSPYCDRPGHLGLSGSGLVVVIDHGGGIATRYTHASALNVEVGDVVAAGQTIAWVGSTGNSTGPHLHFEVHINDQPVDPETFLHNVGVTP